MMLIIKNNTSLFLLCMLLTSGIDLNAQPASTEVVVSGARFTNGLVEKWIADYEKLHPSTKVRIENKGSMEYSNADLIIYARHLEKPDFDKEKVYIVIGRYAVLPVANANSPLVAYYGSKGFIKADIKQAFFYDPIEGSGKKPLKAPYNVYTRVQRAPASEVFAAAFGYRQQDLHGRAIAGADEHLIKSVQRDSLGLTYAPIALIYDPATGLPLAGLQVIPVDFDDNGKVAEEERFYDDLKSVIEKLNQATSANIPNEDIFIAVNAYNAKPEAVQFLQWILNEGQSQLEGYGYLLPDPKNLQKQRQVLEKLAPSN